jgi:predicted permease
MPQGMDFDHRRDVWTPATDDSELRGTDASDLTVIGRLADGAAVEAARAEAAGWSARLAARRGRQPGDYTVRLTTFGDRILGADQRTGYSVLAGAVAFVLLICCANVANLLIARSGRRLPDVAIRLALGATRRRIVRQLLLETTLLAAAAGVLGLVISYVGVDWLRDLVEAAPDRPFWVHIGFDPRVFLFLFVVSLAAGLVSGIAPAWLVSAARITGGLQEKGPGFTQGTGARRLARLMVAGQLAMTLVLLTGAGLLVRTFAEMYRADLGVVAGRILTARIRLPQAVYADDSARRDFYDRLEARLVDVPGVTAASFADAAPLEPRTLRRVVVEPPGAGGDGAANVLVVFVGSRYFETLGVRMRRGRTFDTLDGTPGREVAIVSEAFARSVRGGDPIGRRLRFVEGGSPGGEPSAAPTIVGIAPEIRQNPLFWKGTARAVYLPFRSAAPAEAVILARTSVHSPALLTPLLRDRVRSVDHDQAVYEVKTLATHVEESAGPFRALGSVFGFLGVIGLLMASTGMYATVAWTIEQRRREAGIRLALGADRARVSWLFASTALTDTALGLAVGLSGSVGLGFLLRSIITTPPVDPPTLACVCGILASVTCVAAWLPLRRALQLDPAEILRSE